jgi:hypothetical protein
LSRCDGQDKSSPPNANGEKHLAYSHHVTLTLNSKGSAFNKRSLLCPDYRFRDQTVVNVEFQLGQPLGSPFPIRLVLPDLLPSGEIRNFGPHAMPGPFRDISPHDCAKLTFQLARFSTCDPLPGSLVHMRRPNSYVYKLHLPGQSLPAA